MNARVNTQAVCILTNSMVMEKFKRALRWIFFFFGIEEWVADRIVIMGIDRVG